MIPAPVVVPYAAASTAIVVRVRTHPIRHLRISVRRTSWSPWLRHARVARRGRVWIIRLRPSTTYAIQARACLRRICSRWSRPVFVQTEKALASARVADVTPGHQPGAIPPTGINDLTAATNRPDTFWGDYHALRMSWVRLVVDWHVMQPADAPPDYNTTPWRVIDAFMARARIEGARVLVSIGGIPGWARIHAPSENLGSGARPAAYADWIRLWIARYPQTSAVDQHEANCCSLTEYVATKDLARMLDASYPILRAAGVESIAGSWTEGGVSGARARQAIRELGAIYANRPLAFDSFGLHFYPSLTARKTGTEIAAPPESDSYLMTEFARLQSDIDAAFPGRHLGWSITETGWSTPGGYQGDMLSPEQQAAAAIWELREASRYPRLEKFLWFLDVDQSDNDATRNIYKSGLHYTDGSPKPVYAAWAALASSSGI